ncbi:bifunctional peptidase and (3S)-lysyl hydroxylase Jmjd7 isoform X2 [Anthonomus grandis grandis]|nr:bifunctional peptidase and (3S)-lysyl hydroxylase Jmjd7 isoform X2 [Anthonomus grandis grandis]
MENVNFFEKKRVQVALETLYGHTEDFLYCNTRVPEIPHSELTKGSWSFKFFKEYVSKNSPVLIKGGANELPAIKKWNSDYFREKYPDKLVTVTLTPNGYADGIARHQNEDNFFLPEEVQMPFSDFLTILDEKRPNYVSYIQQQNSNLTEHYPELLLDVNSEFQWASVAFGNKPDAINFWMGDQRAVTSMHKDPYENIYCVIDGFKDFILIPPCDLPYVPYKKYPVKQYQNVTPYGFEVTDRDQNEISWIAADPLNDDLVETYPDFYTTARRFQVRVEKGDILYLPSLWFHHVRQSHKCIAVNY